MTSTRTLENCSYPDLSLFEHDHTACRDLRAETNRGILTDEGLGVEDVADEIPAWASMTRDELRAAIDAMHEAHLDALIAAGALPANS